MRELPVADCPFDAGTELLLDQATEMVEDGRLRTEDFDSQYLFRSPEDLRADLRRLRPAADGRVVIHGDPTLVNFLFEDAAVSGILDVGLAGVGDRYRDLAIAAQSITWNIGGEWAAPLFTACGPSLDRRKLALHALLDQFAMVRRSPTGSLR